MSKIVSMSSGAIDPINVTKRVFWRPVTEATVLKIGQPVCYNSDCVCDHKERTADPTHIGLTEDTYAEGEQEFTGRLFIVEEPLSANLHSFAGIVKSLGPKAGADGDMIEIFTPVDGAIVPVYTDENCTLDRTLLGIRDGEADVTYPGCTIGIAMETKDRSGTDGLVWMKFDSFTRRKNYSSLLIDDECASDVCLNYMQVESAQTSDGLCIEYIKGTLTGTGGFGGGMMKYRAELDAAASDTCQCLSAGLTIKASGELTDAGFTYCNAAFHAGVGTSGTPDLSGGNLACISCTYYADESGGAPQGAWGLWFHSGATYKLDGLFRAFNAGDISDATVTTADITSQDNAADKNIPIKLGTTTYYLRAFVTA